LIILAAVFGAMTMSCNDPELDPATPGLLVPRTVDQDASLPQISVNGTTLNSETFGNPQDPMIIVLHGGPGGDYRSMLNCRHFAANGYFIVFYDQRGSGLSQRHPAGTYTEDVMIGDLEAVIQHYRTSPEQKTYLLGLSWGAMLATAYIDRHPSEIAGAILAEPGGFTWDVAKDYISRTRDAKFYSEQINDVFYFDQIITGKEDQHDIIDYKFALQASCENVKNNPLGNAGPSPFWRYGAAVQQGLFDSAEEQGFDFTQNLGQYNKRVLFLYSELNRAYGPAHANIVASAYPNAELKQIKSCGHEIIYFGWQEFYSTSIEYLNTINN
jgi:proline iminopeptidase